MYFRQLPNKDVAGNLIVVQLSNDEGDSSDSIELLLKRDHLDTRLVELLRSTKSGELRFSCPEVDESIKKHNNFTPFTLEGTLLLDSGGIPVSVPDLYFIHYACTRQCWDFAPWFTQRWSSEKYGKDFLLKPEYEHEYCCLELGKT